ncbi:hypothetical protein HD806DRAFT_501761 [Xylariaceae sp. AK1471]|nr:hypothetical protein HD806DRAFT_501761 [Xylariaceae sp. AK1471]
MTHAFLAFLAFELLSSPSYTPCIPLLMLTLSGRISLCFITYLSKFFLCHTTTIKFILLSCCGSIDKLSLILNLTLQQFGYNF